jgi:hypothetical protein
MVPRGGTASVQVDVGSGSIVDISANSMAQTSHDHFALSEGNFADTLEPQVVQLAPGDDPKLLGSIRVGFQGGSQSIPVVAADAKPACSDGIDNDNDGLADYPSDPGCASPDSWLEAPQCNDGVDNDARTDRPHRDAQGCGDLFVGQRLPHGEGEHVLILFW